MFQHGSDGRKGRICKEKEWWLWVHKSLKLLNDKNRHKPKDRTIMLNVMLSEISQRMANTAWSRFYTLSFMIWEKNRYREYIGGWLRWVKLAKRVKRYKLLVKKEISLRRRISKWEFAFDTNIWYRSKGAQIQLSICKDRRLSCKCLLLPLVFSAWPAVSVELAANPTLEPKWTTNWSLSTTACPPSLTLPCGC